MSNVFGYFSNRFIRTYEDFSKVTDITGFILAAINMFKDHPIIKNIRAKNFKLVFSVTHMNKIGIQKYNRDM